jgi:hypothetical protein
VYALLAVVKLPADMLFIVNFVEPAHVVGSVASIFTKIELTVWKTANVVQSLPERLQVAPAFEANFISLGTTTIVVPFLVLTSVSPEPRLT